MSTRPPVGWSTWVAGDLIDHHPRAARFTIVLTAGRVREEILANIARQLADFSQNLADHAGRLPYAEQVVLLVGTWPAGWDVSEQFGIEFV